MHCALRTAPPDVGDRTCAQAFADADQGKAINQVMAPLVASYVERLLDGPCGWMATYVDLDNCVLQSLPLIFTAPRRLSVYRQVRD